MELNQYIKLIKSNILIVLALSLFGMAIALLMTKSYPQGFAQDQTFFISSQLGQDSDPNQQNNNPQYFEQEKARNFTDSAVAIIESSDFKNEVQNQQGFISAKKVSPQVVRISTSAQTPEAASSLMEKTVSSINQKLITLGQPDLSLKPIAKAQDPSKVQINKQIFALTGLLLGFAFGILAISLKTYFRL